jgi:glycerophosphoryl diester phosphodiesterase
LSFEADLIAMVKKAFPAYRACWLTDYRWRGGWMPSPDQILATLKRCGADGLASRGRSALDAALVSLLKEAGAEIHVWTVDDAPRARRFAALGVDSIMTNRPGWLIAKVMRPPEQPDRPARS